MGSASVVGAAVGATASAFFRRVRVMRVDWRMDGGMRYCLRLPGALWRRTATGRGGEDGEGAAARKTGELTSKAPMPRKRPRAAPLTWSRQYSTSRRRSKSPSGRPSQPASRRPTTACRGTGAPLGCDTTSVERSGRMAGTGSRPCPVQRSTPRESVQPSYVVGPRERHTCAGGRPRAIMGLVSPTNAAVAREGGAASWIAGGEGTPARDRRSCIFGLTRGIHRPARSRV